MAKRNDASKARSVRHRKIAGARSRLRHVIPEPVEDLIEEERERLMRAHSLLDCILVAMGDDDSMPTQGPHYPSLIEIARDLVNESIGQLDATNLQSAREKEEQDEPGKLLDLGGDYMVREAIAFPWCERRADAAAVLCDAADTAIESASKQELLVLPRTRALQ